MEGAITIRFDYNSDEAFDALKDIISTLAPFMVDNVVVGYEVEL